MQCNLCGAVMVPGEACVACEEFTRRVPVRRTQVAGKKDISALAALLISLPFLLLAILRGIRERSDTVPLAIAGFFGAAVLGLALAWLCSRLFKAQFRLTWVIALGVLVGIQSLQPLIASIQARPSPLPPFHVSWPSGWTVLAINEHADKKDEVRDGTATESAVINENGRRAAQAVAVQMMARGPLEDTLGQLVENEMKGTTMAMSTSLSRPEPIHWLGRQGLQQDIVFRQSKEVIHQRVFIAPSSAGYVCAVMYTAGGANFEKFLPPLQLMEDQFPCP